MGESTHRSTNPAGGEQAGDERFAWAKKLDPVNIPRLRVLSRSAYASSLGDEFDLLAEQHAHDEDDARRKQARRRKLLEDIQAEIDAIEPLGQPESGVNWSDYALAHAIALTARGRARHALGNIPKALEDFSRAILLLPDYLDPYLRRAVIYLADLPRCGNLAEADLNRALGLSPSNQRAHFLLGTLLATPAFTRFDDAKSHLLKADLIPDAYRKLAQIYEAHDGRTDKAVAALQRSLSIDPRPDARAVDFIDEVLKLTEEPEPLIPAPPSVATKAAVPVANAAADQASPDPASSVAAPTSEPATRRRTDPASTPKTSADDPPLYRTSAERHELLRAALQFAVGIVKSGRTEKFRELGRKQRDKVQKRIEEFASRGKPKKQLTGSERIALRAYEIWLSGQGGTPEEHWARAQKELGGG